VGVHLSTLTTNLCCSIEVSVHTQCAFVGSDRGEEKTAHPTPVGAETRMHWVLQTIGSASIGFEWLTRHFALCDAELMQQAVIKYQSSEAYTVSTAKLEAPAQRCTELLEGVDLDQQTFQEVSRDEGEDERCALCIALFLSLVKRESICLSPSHCKVKHIGAVQNVENIMSVPSKMWRTK
jgi:hypothetical protein